VKSNTNQCAKEHCKRKTVAYAVMKRRRLTNKNPRQEVEVWKDASYHRYSQRDSRTVLRMCGSEVNRCSTQKVPYG
jgi:hypothetical protein